MNDITNILAAHIAAGDALESALVKLRAEGATPVAVIKAIRRVMKVELAEAKQIFDASPAWQHVGIANRALHDEAIAALISSRDP